MPALVLSSFRGGLNTDDPPSALADDQIVIADNLDLGRSALGGRRLGHRYVTTSGLVASGVFGYRHLPSRDETEAQLWAVSVSGTSSKFVYKDTTWHDVTPIGESVLDVPEGKYRISAQTLHRKLFVAYPTTSGLDRLHVYNPEYGDIRRTGLRAPDAAPVTSGSGSGSLSDTRYHRVRWTRQASGVTNLRSEPSASAAIVLSAKAGVVVTQPASTGEGATHWEVEVSADDATFYRITTLPVASGTYTDTLAPTSFSASGELSEPVTRYSLIHNPKFLATDEDRLIVAGSWEQVPLQSRVAWTPRGAAPGVGNDERLDETTDPFLDLDGAVGGELTGLGGPLQGYVYAFKDARIYKLVPTQNVNQAYIGLLVSTTTGALPRSIIPGEDEQGRPCLYFLDRRTGASRIGANGIENCGQDIHGGTWKDRVNTDASLVAHGVFYPQLQQVWWWVAVDGADTPTMKLAAHVKEFRPSPDGARRGWTVHTGPAMACLASVVYADNLEAGGARSLEVKPYVFTTVASGLINECHIGTQDNGVNYRAYARTKPYVLGDLLVKGGVLAGTIMASGGSGSSVATSLIRDFGAETSTPRVATLTPPSPGQRVIAPMDNLSLTGSYVLQVETGDAAAVNADWEIDMIALKISEEEMV